MCYVTSWAQYRQGVGKFTIENIDPSLCTHVIYAFATIDDDLHIAAAEWNDISTTWYVGNYEKLQQLKNINPELRTILSVGGYTLGSEKFTALSSNEELRADFIQHAITFLRDNEFDGLQIDWQFPTFGTSPPEDRQRHTSLLEEFETAFRKESELPGRRRLILTANVAGEKYYESAYEINKVSRAVDYLTIRAYSLQDPAEFKAIHHTPLYPAIGDSGQHETTESVINLWINGGVQYSKIVLGIATFAQTFTLANSSESYVGAPTIGLGNPGPVVNEPGLLSYYEVCMLLNDSDIYFDDEQMATYAVLGDQWISFDDPKSVEEKIEWVKQNGFAGVAIWSMPLDDFTGSSCHDGELPLSSTAVDTLFTGSLTLINGYSNREGNIIVRQNGTWGYVCNEIWTQENANVACKQLGYTASESIGSVPVFEKLTGLYYPVIMNDINCDGTETRLDQCAWSEATNHSCHPVSLRCKSDVRFREIENESHRLLEIYWNGNWGSVCSTGWTSFNADVVCRMLGFLGSDLNDCCSSNPITKNSIYVADVKCDGNEDHIKSCPHAITSVCESNKVVGVKCIIDECEFGWSYIGGKCVYISSPTNDIFLNWTDSMNSCSEDDAELMIIRNENELEELYNKIVYFWIGLNDEIEENVFRWEDGTISTYDNWLSGEPNNLGCNRNCIDANCVAMENKEGFWVDEKCTRRNRFVCKSKDSIFNGTSNCKTNYNGYCYMASRVELSWHDARKYCNKRNATLSSVNDFEEALWLVELMKRRTDYWTAVNDINEESVYRGNNNVQIEYLKWASDQPDDKGIDGNGSDCVIFLTKLDGEMDDIECHRQHAWLCERPHRQTGTTPGPIDEESEKDLFAVKLIVSTCSAVFILLLILIVIVIKRRKSKRSELAALAYKRDARKTSHTYLPHPMLHPAEDFKDMEIHRNRVTIKKKIGGGEFGKVMMGYVAGIRGSSGTIKVAIKCLRDNSASKDDFLDEIQLMIELGKHQNIIKLLGCVTVDQPYMALFEFMPYGDLLQFLRKAREVGFYVTSILPCNTYLYHSLA
ncbi:uncharacterized protein LOC117122741 [Anneissia japonica]|uniref:uncharacterized protein LOC117122741 n=1 Tax=Anneissia japonica TaxID=1529436 RepID=UPI00142571EC|nr:uncharacterized protein LOC117122741 [Anneissia japonica]